MMLGAKRRFLFWVGTTLVVVGIVLNANVAFRKLLAKEELFASISDVDKNTNLAYVVSHIDLLRKTSGVAGICVTIGLLLIIFFLGCRISEIEDIIKKDRKIENSQKTVEK